MQRDEDTALPSASIDFDAAVQAENKKMEAARDKHKKDMAKYDLEHQAWLQSIAADARPADLSKAAGAPSAAQSSGARLG